MYTCGTPEKHPRHTGDTLGYAYRCPEQQKCQLRDITAWPVYSSIQQVLSKCMGKNTKEVSRRAVFQRKECLSQKRPGDLPEHLSAPRWEEKSDSESSEILPVATGGSSVAPGKMEMRTC